MVGEEGGATMMLCLDIGSICPCKYNNLSPPNILGEEGRILVLDCVFVSKSTHILQIPHCTQLCNTFPTIYSFNDSIVQL